MPVAVVGTDGHQSDCCVKPSVERVALVGRSVVSDLDDIRGPDLSRREEFVLRIFAQVAEKHRPQPSALHRYRHAAGVPAHRRQPGFRHWRPQDAPLELADVPPHSREPLSDLRSGPPEIGEDALVCIPARLPDDDRPRHADDACQTTDVVGVVVGEDEQFQSIHAEPLEAGLRRLRLPSDIDHRDAVAVPNEQAVALSDIARGDLPIGRQREHSTDRSPAQTPRIDPGTRDQRRCRD
ncbi:MAG TPA: hypothetical protein VGO99_08735, partial [Leifsonia sp.]|nr:hypothetical protein [Leifsonia sp.]